VSEALDVAPGFTFTVPGLPVAKGRPRFARVGGFVRTFTPATSARFEERVRLCAQAAGVEIQNDGALEMIVVAYWPMTGTPLKRGSRVERFKCSRPDADNVLKSVADSLNGVAYKDDAQIARAVVEKRHCAQDDPDGARVEITVRRL
jgi:Holliday junction resolvase RusA-like endonuclease